MTFDRFDVATRLRGLIGGQDRGVIGATANRLGVGEMALRMSVDEIDPHPTFEVLLAVVREYGVDPTWIVSGQYDVDGHRRALEDDAAIARLLSHATSPQPRPRSSAALRLHEVAADSERMGVATERVAHATRRDTRTRWIDGDGLRWKVNEVEWAATDRRTGTCLIFDAETVIRRVRDFPSDWYEWSEADLYAVSLRPGH
jgi:hypothetical protein